MRSRKFLAVAACMTMVAGCAGNGMGLDQGGRPLPPGGADGGVLTADFDSIQQHVFTPICTICHSGSNAPQGLRLDAASSYGLLVGVSSSEVRSIQRVQPGDPANSYLVQKLEGHAAVGAQMPFGGPPLPAATIAVIRQWITDGALRSPLASAAAQRFAALSVTPAPGDVLRTAPALIVIAFSEDLDQTRIDASSVQLESLASLDSGPPLAVPVALIVPAGNPRALILEPATPLAAGNYRVVISGQNATGLTAIAGERFGAGNSNQGETTVVTRFEVMVQP